MPFFQNLLNTDFYGVLVIGDRAHSLDFRCPPNAGRNENVVSNWVNGPYNLSGNDTDGNTSANLVIWYATSDMNYANWASMTINVTTGAASTSAVKATEIITALTANATFSAYFTAGLANDKDGDKKIYIKGNLPITRFKFYIANGNAEETLKFNARAGVAELPTYFTRHSFTNRNAYPDSQGTLILLAPGTSNVDAAVINNATDAKGVSLGLASGTVQADYLLLRGKSGVFTFKKQTVNSNSQITQIIEYPAGAKAGDFAKKTTMSYTGTQTYPDVYAEVPYTLTSGDLITPP